MKQFHLNMFVYNITIRNWNTNNKNTMSATIIYSYFIVSSEVLLTDSLYSLSMVPLEGKEFHYQHVYTMPSGKNSSRMGDFVVSSIHQYECLTILTIQF